MGFILLSFQSAGKIPDEIDKLNNLHNTGTLLDAVCLSIFEEIPSLPVDLEVSSSKGRSNTESSPHKKISGQLLEQRELSKSSWPVLYSGSCV